MNISIVGAGHVGLVTGACLAQLKHRVVIADHDARKIKMLARRRMPFYEPGLEPLVKEQLGKRRLRLTTSVRDAVTHGTVIFICVGTPPRPNGEADLSAVEHVCRDIAAAMRSYRLIVEKSTVPVETGEWIKRTMRLSVRKGVPFDVASNPEFLREGSAVEDFLKPDRVVIGVETERAKRLLLEIYRPFHAAMVVTDVKSAELIKHASNSFLAVKISFINAIAQLCDRVGADVLKVADGMGRDPRIGRAFLHAGVGYGGSCFPKDVAAFIRIAEQLGYDFRLLKAAAQVNQEQRQFFVKRVADSLWTLNDKIIGVLGLAFKPDTDDVREAPSIDVIQGLQREGAVVRAYDPQALAQANGLLSGVKLCRNVYEMAKGADCLAMLTEWEEFKRLDFARIKTLMRQPVIVDGRNALDGDALKRLGFRYVGIGRGHGLD